MSAQLAEKNWHFDIDIVGGCNLRCPSCPVGNSDYAAVPKGYMKLETLDRILCKAKRECGRPDISLYNWTEPFLHPDLAGMIRLVKQHGLPCTVSTNLNILKNLDAVLSAEPDVIRTSVSAFTQEKYQHTHVRGNIENVKKNMIRMSEAKKRLKSRTKLTILFHRYLNNIDDEVSFRNFAEKLGFKFQTCWAYLMPLEKVLELSEPGSTGVGINDADRAVIEKLALPITEALEVCKAERSRECGLRDNQVSLTVEGTAMLCCGAYDQNKYAVGSYLTEALAELQKKRRSHRTCGTCIRNGVNSLAAYHPRQELDEIAFRNTAMHNHGKTHPRQNKGPLRRSLSPIAYAIRDKIRKVKGHINRLPV